MKTKLILTIVIFAISFAAYAQDFSFTYDDAGNRTNRNVITLPPPPNKSGTQDTTLVSEEAAAEEEIAEQEKLQEQLGDLQLLVYPNPTKGMVVVEIASASLGATPTLECSYKVFDLSGREILAGQATGSTISVNLSEQVAGMYLLKVKAGEEEKSWKVVKE